MGSFLCDILEVLIESLVILRLGLFDVFFWVGFRFVGFCLYFLCCIYFVVYFCLAVINADAFVYFIAKLSQFWSERYLLILYLTGCYDIHFICTWLDQIVVLCRKFEVSECRILSRVWVRSWMTLSLVVGGIFNVGWVECRPNAFI